MSNLFNIAFGVPLSEVLCRAGILLYWFCLGQASIFSFDSMLSASSFATVDMEQNLLVAKFQAFGILLFYDKKICEEAM